MRREGRITGIYGTWNVRGPGERIKGNGKTLTAVYLLYLDYKRGYRTFANIETTFTEKMSTQEVFDLFRDSQSTGISILLDEIQKDLNSLPGSTSPVLIKEFCNIAGAQTRKRDINLYWTTQRASDVPLRLRVQTDILLQPIRIHADGTRCNAFDCDRTHYVAVYSREPAKIKPIVKLNCSSVGCLYDTNQIITDGMEVTH
jgi:hypothetical protein